MPDLISMKYPLPPMCQKASPSDGSSVVFLWSGCFDRRVRSRLWVPAVSSGRFMVLLALVCNPCCKGDCHIKPTDGCLVVS